MKIENYQVKELNSSDLKHSNGGFWTIAGRIVIAAGLLRAAEEVWEGFKEGVKEALTDDYHPL